MDRRAELGNFLQARRNDLRPEDVGLTHRGRRRVRGLRREEVAHLAGISISWYTWLEQGRDIKVSDHALAAIANALGLSGVERRYVRCLSEAVEADQSEVVEADQSEVVEADQSEVVEADQSEDGLGSGLTDLLNGMLPDPAFLVTTALDIVSWNRSGAILFEMEHPPPHRNALWLLFRSPDHRRRIVDWERHAQTFVSQFRYQTAAMVGDAQFDALLRELGESPEFQEMWNRRHVEDFRGTTLEVHHPVGGLIRTQMFQLRPLDHPGLIMIVYRTVDRESHDRLHALLGTNSVPSDRVGNAS